MIQLYPAPQEGESILRRRNRPGGLTEHDATRHSYGYSQNWEETAYKTFVSVNKL